MVNVICMKWGTRYDAAYVNRLRGMVRRHLVQPHRFVCFTDDTNGLRPEVETRPLPRIEQPQGQEERFWQKLGTFARPLADLSGPTLFLDLDVIITSDIDCFFEQPGEFCIIREWRNDGPPRGNSSVYRFEAGAHVEVLKEFERDPQAVASRCMFDQDFMSATVQPLTFWPDEWCRSFKKHCLAPVPWCYFTVPKIPPRARIIVFHGHPKPVEAARGCLVRGGIKYCRATPWIEEHSRV